MISVFVSLIKLVQFQNCLANYQCPTNNELVEDCNSECKDFKVLDVDDKKCIERQIFSRNFVGYDIGGVGIWFVGAGFAVSAGVGGGGIFRPLGELLLRFDQQTATALSHVSIFGASSAGLLLNAFSRHPAADRPLIDFDMVLFLAPMEMAGAILGYIVLSMIPTWLVVILMVVVLGYTGFRTLQKGMDTWKKDKERRQDKGVDLSEVIPEPKEKESPETSDDDSRTAPPEKRRRKFHSVDTWLRKDASRPLKKVGYLAAMWLILLLFTLLRGGKGGKSIVPGWEFCGPEYWILTASSFVFLFGFSLIMGWRAVSKSTRKLAVSFPSVEGDVFWTAKSIVGYASCTFVAGILAGMIGIGGGMVLGPLMLRLGVLAQVSTASTGTMIVLTSSSVAAIAIVQGNLPWSYVLTFFLVSFCGALIGKYKIDKLVKEKGLTSLLIFILAAIILLAPLVMGINTLILYGQKDWDFSRDPKDRFRSICD